ncbi:MAG: twin-arginine translocation signal domain-containing protein, partial [Raoultibacter sp.]
ARGSSSAARPRTHSRNKGGKPSLKAGGNNFSGGIEGTAGSGFSSTPSRSSQPGITLPLGNGEILLTRRHFLYGALGIGVVAAAAFGGGALQEAAKKRDSITYLEVPENAVFTLSDCTEIPLDQGLQLTGSYEFPYGTLVWSSNDTNAACLLPTETAKPLVHVGIITLASGE